jgi:hypothetical protein
MQIKNRIRIVLVMSTYLKCQEQMQAKLLTKYMLERHTHTQLKMECKHTFPATLQLRSVYKSD